MTSNHGADDSSRDNRSEFLKRISRHLKCYAIAVDYLQDKRLIDVLRNEIQDLLPR